MHILSLGIFLKQENEFIRLCSSIIDNKRKDSRESVSIVATSLPSASWTTVAARTKQENPREGYFLQNLQQFVNVLFPPPFLLSTTRSIKLETFFLLAASIRKAECIRIPGHVSSRGTHRHVRERMLRTYVPLRNFLSRIAGLLSRANHPANIVAFSLHSFAGVFRRIPPLLEHSSSKNILPGRGEIGTCPRFYRALAEKKSGSASRRRILGKGEGLDAVRRILIPFPFRGIHLLSRGERFKKFERESLWGIYTCCCKHS